MLSHNTMFLHNCEGLLEILWGKKRQGLNIMLLCQMKFHRMCVWDCNVTKYEIPPYWIHLQGTVITYRMPLSTHSKYLTHNEANKHETLQSKRRTQEQKAPIWRKVTKFSEHANLTRTDSGHVSWGQMSPVFSQQEKKLNLRLTKKLQCCRRRCDVAVFERLKPLA